MDFAAYDADAAETAIYPKEAKVMYPALGLAGEAGEVCEKIKKHIRDGAPLDRVEIAKELGDVLWYVAAIARDVGVTLNYVAELNLQKLRSRKVRGQLQGNGDNR